MDRRQTLYPLAKKGLSDFANCKTKKVVVLEKGDRIIFLLEKKNNWDKRLEWLITGDVYQEKDGTLGGKEALLVYGNDGVAKAVPWFRHYHQDMILVKHSGEKIVFANLHDTDEIHINESMFFVGECRIVEEMRV